MTLASTDDFEDQTYCSQGFIVGESAVDCEIQRLEHLSDRRCYRTGTNGTVAFCGLTAGG